MANDAFRPRPLAASVICLLILASFVVATTAVFWAMGTNFALWYLKNGSLIALLVSLTALVGEDDAQVSEHLVSANPGEYLAGCAGILAVLFHSFGISVDSTPSVRFRFWRRVEELLSFLGTLALVMCAFTWVVVIAPTNYFITIVTGAVERSFRASDKEIVARTKNGKLEIEAVLKSARTDDQKKVGFFKPLAVTQVLTAALLWVLEQQLVPGPEAQLLQGPK
jgi:hypothetical protein